MPRVPSEFVPQVPLQDGQMPAYQAPEVVPMRSFAGEQQAEMGNAMRNTGNVVWRIGQIIQDEINEARVKEGVVQLGNGANTILKGENGYFTNEGKAADTQFGTSEMALNEAANNILDGLDNDAQKAVFRQVAAQHLMSWKGSMADHRNREVRKYNINTSLASEAMNADLAGIELGSKGPTAHFFALQGAALNNRKQALMLQGIPDGSPIMVDQLRSARLNIAKAGIRGMIDRNDYQGALKFIESMTRPVEAGPDAPPEARAAPLSADDIGPLKSELLARRNPQMDRELAFSIKNSGTFETEAGTGRYDMPVESADADIKVITGEEPEFEKDGKTPILDAQGKQRTRVVSMNEVRYTVLPNTPVQASTDAVVEDVGGDTVTLSTGDGTKIFYKGLSGITVKAGDPVSRRQMLGTPKAAQDGKASFTYSLTRNGIAIPASSPNMLPINIGGQKKGRPATLTEALDMVSMLPTDRQAGVRAELRRLYVQDAEQLEAQRIDAIVDAKMWFMQQVGNKPVEDATRPVVTREQVIEHLTRRGTIAFVSSDDIQSIVDNTGTPGWVIAQFEAGNMTPAMLQKYADVVSNDDYNKMRDQLAKPEYLEFKFANDELSDIFAQLDMGANYVNPARGSTYETEVINIRRNLNELVRRAQQEKGEKLNMDERKALAKQALGMHVWTKGAMKWKPQRVMSMAFADSVSQRPYPGELNPGETRAEYDARVDAWEQSQDERISYEERVDGAQAPERFNLSAAEVRDAMTELAALGEPIDYNQSVWPTGLAISKLREAKASKSDIRKIMQETRGLMTPAERSTLIRVALLEQDRDRAVALQESGKQLAGEPVPDFNVDQFVKRVIAMYTETRKAGQ